MALTRRRKRDENRTVSKARDIATFDISFKRSIAFDAAESAQVFSEKHNIPWKVAFATLFLQLDRERLGQRPLKDEIAIQQAGHILEGYNLGKAHGQKTLGKRARAA
jgi:hypothetical protein